MILYTLIRTSIIISDNEPDTESYSKTFFEISPNKEALNLNKEALN